MGFKLAISNIAWDAEDDIKVYEYLKKCEIHGLEIAPTRVFGQLPYDDLSMVEQYKVYLKNEYELNVCSLQSIWYGKTEKIFGTKEERKILEEYTKKAIIFSETIGAGNLVFGCPKNRNIDSSYDENTATLFFGTLGDFASLHKTIIAMEANPAIYGTNYINYTKDAIKLVREIGSDGFKLNLDFGTIVENKEDINFICKNVDIINHVHISEPFLEQIKDRPEHRLLLKLLLNEHYDGYVSIEMKKQETINDVFKTIDYLKEIVEKCND